MFGAEKFRRFVQHPGCNKGKGGGGSSTTVQKADPWSGIQPYLLNLYGGAQEQFDQGPWEVYGGDRLAESPAWLTGNVTNSVKGTQAQLPSLSNTMWGAMSPALTATSVNEMNNPFLAGMAGDLVNRTQQSWQDMAQGIGSQLTENVLPGIQDDFQGAGSLGASRQALLQGNAIGKAAEAVAKEGGRLNTNLAGQLSSLYGGIYENAAGRDLQRLGLQTNAAQAIPQLAQFPLQLQQAAMQTYAPIKAEEQAALDAQRQLFEQQQSAAYENLRRYASIIEPGAGIGGTTTTQSPNYSTNPLTAMLPLMMYAMM